MIKNLKSVSLFFVFFVTLSTMSQNQIFKYNQVVVEPEVYSIMSDKWNNDFKHVEYPKQWLENVIQVKPGQSIQKAIDQAHAKGGGVVFLKKGTHVLD